LGVRSKRAAPEGVTMYYKKHEPVYSRELAERIKANCAADA